MSKMGIYAITHIESGKQYIGSSLNIERRFRQHRYDLKNKTHQNRKVQNAWNKYGQDAFRFHILDYVEDENELLTWEQQWVDSISPFYNIRKKVDTNRGRKGHIPWNKGLKIPYKSRPPRTKEWKEQHALTMTGRHVSSTTKDKMSASHKGKPSALKGRPWSEARRQAQFAKSSPDKQPNI